MAIRPTAPDTTREESNHDVGDALSAAACAPDCIPETRPCAAFCMASIPDCNHPPELPELPELPGAVIDVDGTDPETVPAIPPRSIGPVGRFGRAGAIGVSIPGSESPPVGTPDPSKLKKF